MDTGLIPHRYAKALYKFALENGDTRHLYEVAKRVIDTFRENPPLQKVLSNPFVANEDKESLLMSAAGKKVDEDYRKFVKLIIDQKRVEFAYEMMLAYRDIFRKENKISQVRITTAGKLQAHQLKKLRDLVEASFKDREFEYSESIDPQLIGGFVIDVDSIRMDASVSNELEQLRQTLLGS